MSTNVGRSLTITYDNVLGYFSGYGNAKIHVNSYSNDQIICLSLGDKSGGANLTDSAKNILFPNSTAHPTKAEMTWLVHGIVATGTAKLIINGDTVLSGNIPNGDVTLTGSGSGSGVKSATKSSTISYELTKATATFGYVGCWKGSDIGPLTLYFTRYDFSATKGTGIASASVSSATGYDGDTITFTATPAEGYIFDHWSDGSTDNPHTITVSGADKSLTAYGAATTKNLSVVYGNSLIVNEQIMGDVNVTYNGALFTLTDGTKTLNCKGKYMTHNVNIGAKTLLCKDQVARYNIPVLLAKGEWQFNKGLSATDRPSIKDENGWCVTPFIYIPVGCQSVTAEVGAQNVSEYSLCYAYDGSLNYLRYWGGSNPNPYTMTIDISKYNVKYLVLTMNMDNLDRCYVFDNTHGQYIYKGGNV